MSSAPGASSASALLPPNATDLERAEAQATARVSDVPVPLRELWNPQTCPIDLLPYLAWGFSVARWDTDWPDARQREAVANAYYIHAHKGTISAMRRVVEPLGYSLRVTEWWQTDPPGEPGTLQIVDIGLADKGIDEDTRTAIERLLAEAKPLTRPIVELTLSIETHGAAHLGAAVDHGDTLTVYPYQPGPITVAGTGHAGAGLHTIDTVSIPHV
ncbi:phage tail protein I [Salinisphaera orenii]|uniref:phage tail protein I n=1 Tax=Salinisphaera orenii TaxID=856731 RepID=UPI000DBE9E20